MAMSAVASVSTSGVLVTVMPRALAAARSMCSTPTEKVAIARTSSGRRSICGPGQGSVAQVRIGDRPGRALDQLVRSVGPIIRIEPGLVVAPQALLDRLRQLAGDEHDGPAGGHRDFFRAGLELGFSYPIRAHRATIHGTKEAAS